MTENSESMITPSSEAKFIGKYDSRVYFNPARPANEQAVKVYDCLTIVTINNLQRVTNLIAKNIPIPPQKTVSAIKEEPDLRVQFHVLPITKVGYDSFWNPKELNPTTRHPVACMPFAHGINLETEIDKSVFAHYKRSLHRIVEGLDEYIMNRAAGISHLSINPWNVTLSQDGLEAYITDLYSGVHWVDEEKLLELEKQFEKPHSSSTTEQIK